LNTRGPTTYQQLASTCEVNERYTREWLAHQAASNYLSYNPTDETFSLPPEQAMVFANEESPVAMMGAFDAIAACADGKERIEKVFKPNFHSLTRKAHLDQCLSFLGTTPFEAGREVLERPPSENRDIALIFGVRRSEMLSSAVNASIPSSSRSRRKALQKGSDF
jgi:hypothetical protein